MTDTRSATGPMISFTNTIDIPRPTSDVDEYLVDLEHLPEWSWGDQRHGQGDPGR